MAAAYTAAAGAKGTGLYHAGENLLWFLGNTGTDMFNSPDHLIAELASFDQEVANAVVPLAASAYAALTAKGGGTQSFASGWLLCDNQSGDRSGDWFLALGGFRYAVSGVVSVAKGEKEGTWKGELSYVVHVFDRYNWDAGKSIGKFGVTLFKDDWMASLHRLGLAREFVVRGTSESSYGTADYNGAIVPKPTASVEDPLW
jgi:hypothetical protein